MRTLIAFSLASVFIVATATESTAGPLRNLIGRILHPFQRHQAPAPQVVPAAPAAPAQPLPKGPAVVVPAAPPASVQWPGWQFNNCPNGQCPLPKAK